MRIAGLLGGFYTYSSKICFVEQFRFLNWKVYTEAQSLFFKIQKTVDSLSYEKRSYIGKQVLRSALSIVLNIAEGSGKSSEKELVRFIDIALGSLYETRAVVDTLEKMGHLSIAEAQPLYAHLTSIGRQLGGLKKKAKQKV